VKIISELQDTPNSNSSFLLTNTPYIPLPTLNLLFIRLDTQASTIAADRSRHLLSPTLDYGASGYAQDIPEGFSSFEEARNSLDYMRTFAVRATYTAGIPTAMSESLAVFDAAKVRMTLEIVRSVVALRMKQWNVAFDAFVALTSNTNTFISTPNTNSESNGRARTKKEMTEEQRELWEMEQEGIHILKLHAVTMGTNFEVDFERAMSDETVWDNFNLQFEAVVEHAEQIVHRTYSTTPLESNVASPKLSCSSSYDGSNGGSGVNGVNRNRDGKSRARKVTFNIDTGIIPPLYFVAVKCRHSLIRRRAIACLNVTERQEGIWNSRLTARVAERVMEIEEGVEAGEQACFEAATQLLGENLVAGVEVKFHGEERKAWLRYRRIRNREGEGTVVRAQVEVEEWVTW
jgi:hypothetical protein